METGKAHNPLAHLNIIQFGPYPPVMGGVSTHVRRLHRRLLSGGAESGVVTQYDWKGSEAHVFPERAHGRPLCYLRSLLFPWLPVSASLVHCHEPWGHLAPSLLRLRNKGKSIVITVHDQRDDVRWKEHDPLQRVASLQLLRKRDVRWIAVSQTVKEQLVARGVVESHCSVIPAYLPPGSISSYSALPEVMEVFIRHHSPILSVYGFRYWVENGVDVYGFDMCIQVLEEIIKCYPNAGLVMFTPDINNHPYYESLRKHAHTLGLLNNILFYTEPMDEAYPLWQASDVYLRPSTTDGDAVAIREALSLNVPVVASDASTRPAGTRVFRCRDQRDFTEAVMETLENRSEIREKLSHLEKNDRFKDIVAVYSDALEARKRARKKSLF